jgi:hypothetical protein
LYRKEKNVTLVTVLCHENLEFAIDSEEAFSFYHLSERDKGEFIFTFIVDNNEELYNQLCERYGKSFVYFTGTKNGWGRGCLRSIIGGVDYFEKIHNFNDMISFDSDSLCTGSFLSKFSKMARKDKKIFFAGSSWSLPKKWEERLLFFHEHAGSGSDNLNIGGKVVGGPCMLWTESCLEYLRANSWLPLDSFESKYQHLFWPHDQISTYLEAAIGCRILKISLDMFQSYGIDIGLPLKHDPIFGTVPKIGDARVVHPIFVAGEDPHDSEKKCRDYFRDVRSKISKKEINRSDWVSKDMSSKLLRKPVVVLNTTTVRSKNCGGKSCKKNIKTFV